MDYEIYKKNYPIKPSSSCDISSWCMGTSMHKRCGFDSHSDKLNIKCFHIRTAHDVERGIDWEKKTYICLSI